MGETDRRQAVESLLSDLVRLETENPPGNEGRCTAYLRDWFDERDISTTILEKPDPERPQIAAEIGTGSPTLVLNGHMDVVPAGAASKWNHDPYGAEIEDGKLYGRGSVDMKAGLAIAMLTAERLAEPIESDQLAGSLIVHGAIGEETGEPGTKTLLEQGFDGDYGVVLEPTQLRTITSVKGLIWYEIVVNGEPCHASQPDTGRNAISTGIPVLRELAEYGKRVRQRSDPLVGSAYATITGVEAGIGSNKAVLPDDLTITLDRRVLPDETAETIDAELDALLSDLGARYDLDIEWHRPMTCESAGIPTDAELARVFMDHSQTVAGVTPQAGGMGITTDTRNFVNDAGMEAITWGPGNIEQAHARDEYVDLDEVVNGLQILERAARKLLTE